MVRLMEVHDLTTYEARIIAQTQLPSLMEKLVRKAHKEGSKGRKAYADHVFTGSLLDAAIRLRDEFEDRVRECVSSEAWNVGFGYTVYHYAPGTVMIRLK